MAKVSELIEAQQILAERINSVYTNFMNRDENKRTKGAAQAHVQRLEEYFNTFNSHHDQILKMKDVNLKHEYFASTFLLDVEDYYYENKGQFNDFLIQYDIDHPHNNSLNSTQIIKEVSSSGINLPPLDIPKFSGKYTDWETFRDLFTSVVHNKESVSPADKLVYLKNNIQGKALEIASKYKVTAANYPVVWNDLVSYYENKRRLVNTHLTELFSVKPMKAETSSALAKLQREINTPVDSLKTLGMPTDQWSVIIVFLTISRFDENTSKDWQKFQGDSRVPATKEELDKFIASQIIYLESIESNNLMQGHSCKKNLSSSSHQTTSQLTNSVPIDSKQRDESTPKQKSCEFCSEEHLIYKCDKFKALDVRDRFKFIKETALCTQCLHRHTKPCSSKYKCKVCHRKHHHTLLHFTNQRTTQKEKQNEDRVDKISDNVNVNLAQGAQSQNKRDNNSISLNTNHTVNSIYNQSSMASQSHLTSSFKGVILSTAIIRVCGDNGIELTVRAIIDQCSQVSFISGSLAQRLKLKNKKVNVPITGTGGVLLTSITKATHVNIKPRFHSDFTCKVDAFILPKITSYRPPVVRTHTPLRHISGLVLSDPYYMEDSHIDVLLGAAVYSQIIEGTVIKGNDNEPIATRSALGWLLSGVIEGNSSYETSQLTSLHIAQEADLDNLLQMFWVQEEVPKAPMLTPEEQEFQTHFEQSHTRTDEGRYILRLPFKESVSRDKIDFTSSYHTSSKMLQKMEARFRNDAKFKDMYHAFLYEYENMGHMTNVSLNSKLYQNFIPHHGVWKEKSTSTKLRTVFNGSSKLNCGLSLNDLLLVGPNLLPLLTDMLMGWQNYRYVFVADIEKMYRQILIHPDDRPYQCILWRYDSSEPTAVYELNTVTYGLASSPCQANLTIKQLAKDHMIDHPWGASVLHDEIYMDDVLSGGHTIQEAEVKQNDCTQILLKGGFPLRKYQSNHPDILCGIVDDYLAISSKSFANFETSVLGLSWNPSEDNFSFNVLQFEPTTKLTKRVILSRTAKLFDPLGWLAPIIINAKILMQLLWQEKKGWDEEISSDHQKFWLNWEAEFSEINNIKIPRWNNYSPNAEIIEIHGFSDASKLAYGACLYLRIVRENNVFVSLVTAKSKVAPLKSLSIPRLELSAAYLLAKLAKHYLKTSKICITSSHMWSDSTDVLQWLKGHPSRWKTFVANRCSSIHEDMPEARWHYVKSKDNPADIVSRGCTASNLTNKSLWWTGPPWLTQSKTDWISHADQPLELKEPPVEENCLKPVVHLNTQPSYKIDLIYRLSSFTKLLRVTSYCLRFIARLLNVVNDKRQKQINIFTVHLKNYVTLQHSEWRENTNLHTLIPNVESRLTTNLYSRFMMLSFMKSSVKYDSTELQPDELMRARLFVIYLHQDVHFAEVRSLLMMKAKLPKSSPILKLNPFIDKELIRVGGRLVNSQLPHENKYPLLLHHNDELTKMLIWQTHINTYHGGVQLTLGTLRLQYWILNGRTAVKSFIQRCHKCRLYSKRNCTQLMGNLPLNRTLPSKPFSISGIDYAGPIKVRLAKVRGNVTQKGYIAVFVCFSTHAIHIEVVEDYTSDAFIAAFHRFTSRRGHCSELHSDQGTTLIGADSELRKMFHGAVEWSKKINIRLSNNGTRWHFNPPGAPHFGGLWESAVKSMKHHVRRMIGDQALTFIEYSTLLCRIEAILNSRPLLPLSDNISDLNPLTPAHFLIQRSSYLIPEPDRRDDKIPLSKRWELLTQMTQHFWDRWSAEYLTSLQSRSKWTQSQPCIQVGDIVRIKNETTFPGKWPLGIVKEVHPGVDRLVRTATIRTADTELKRPIVKLVLLERASATV